MNQNRFRLTAIPKALLLYLALSAAAVSASWGEIVLLARLSRVLF